MDCEICANGNKTSPSLVKERGTETERPCNAPFCYH